jgi:hypothetical protein
MSAVNSVAEPTRRQGAPTTRPTQASAQPAKVGFAPEQSEQEFKMNLSDIPRLPETMDVEGFKPSLLSRLVDLLAPLRSR